MLALYNVEQIDHAAALLILFAVGDVIFVNIVVLVVAVFHIFSGAGLSRESRPRCIHALSALYRPVACAPVYHGRPYGCDWRRAGEEGDVSC